MTCEWIAAATNTKFRSHGQLVWMRVKVLRTNTHEEAQWHRRSSLLKWMHICKGTRCLAIRSAMKTRNTNQYIPKLSEFILSSEQLPRANTNTRLHLSSSRLFILITKINTCSIIAMLLRYSPYHYRSGLSHRLHAYSIYTLVVRIPLRMFLVGTDCE